MTAILALLVAVVVVAAAALMALVWIGGAFLRQLDEDEPRWTASGYPIASSEWVHSKARSK